MKFHSVFGAFHIVTFRERCFGLKAFRIHKKLGYRVILLLLSDHVSCVELRNDPVVFASLTDVLAMLMLAGGVSAGYIVSCILFVPFLFSSLLFFRDR